MHNVTDFYGLFDLIESKKLHLFDIVIICNTFSNLMHSC